MCFKVTIRGDGLSYVSENGVTRGVECSKTHTGISLFSFPRKRAGINPFPPSNVLGVQLALRGVHCFTALPPSEPGIYTQPRVRVRAYVVLPCSQGSLNGLSAVPRWQEPWKQVKWSTVLLSRGRAPKSPVLFPLPPRTARPNLHFRPRVLPPCQPGPWRRPRPRWKASSIGSMSGRPTIRKPRAGKDSTW